MNRHFIITGFLLLTACASGGIKVEQSKLSQLEKGKTTYDQVVAICGKPTQTGIKDDGTKVIYYTYYSTQARPETFIPYVGVFVGGADTENSTVSMAFDKKDVLRSYTSTQGSTGIGTGFEAISQPRNDAQPAIVQ